MVLQVTGNSKCSYLNETSHVCEPWESRANNMKQGMASDADAVTGD